MNWISNFVRPKINAIFSRKNNSETLWVKCESCNSMIFHKEFSQNLNVCPSCNYHMYISPEERFKSIFDEGVTLKKFLNKEILRIEIKSSL